jgi:predicted deacylase
MQIHRDRLLTLELPYRERLALRRTVFHGGDRPKVAILAGVHGDELEDLYVCHRLAAWIEALASTQPEAFLGQIELFPAMNPLGLDTLRRLIPVYEHALVVFLQRTGIVYGKPASEDAEEDVHYVGVEQTARILAETAGLFISHLEVGRWIQAADLIGQVFDGFDGQLRAGVRTPVSDLVSGIRRQPLLFEGDLLARIQTQHMRSRGKTRHRSRHGHRWVHGPRNLFATYPPD